MASWVDKFRFPMMTEMMRSRGLALSLVGIAAAQVLSSMFLHLGLPCAFHETLHIPCPGCGLTRSVMAMGHGQFGYSFSLHPFGYLMVAGLLACLFCGVAPRTWRIWFLNRFEKLESTTGITTILLIAFMLLWAVRITGVLPLAPV